MAPQHTDSPRPERRSVLRQPAAAESSKELQCLFELKLFKPALSFAFRLNEFETAALNCSQVIAAHPCRWGALMLAVSVDEAFERPWDGADGDSESTLRKAHSVGERMVAWHPLHMLNSRTERAIANLRRDSQIFADEPS